MISKEVRTGLADEPVKVTRREEMIAFVALAILIWPILAVGVVGGYGFLVWMYQMIFGPPGPPN